MDPVVVVGSGPSGVHFALTLLERGRRVVMLDVGRRRPEPVHPELDLNGLKSGLADPAAYLLGEDFEALVLPEDEESEYYGFPPSKSYIFEGISSYQERTRGFAPLTSFAAGGLAEAWTGGCYPFGPDDFRDFPFGVSEMGPCYGRVAERIGISGAKDDLADFLPLHEGLLEPLELDEHSALLLQSYERRRERIQSRLGAFVGRSRIATLSRAHAGREACGYLGRCLWGCPTDSLYTPSVTLRECLSHERFEYVAGVHVSHFRYSDGGRVERVIAREVSGGSEREFEVGTLVLAAGTLSSSKILLDSVHRDTGELPALEGLMDNRQVLMPFVNLRMVGRPFEARSYQYHQLAIGLRTEDPADYVHGLVTTLKTALIHPIVQNVPLSLGGSLELFRNVHAGLGLVNINLPDTRRVGNLLRVEPRDDGPGTRLVVEYAPDPGERKRLARVTRTFRRLLRQLGCIVPPGMTRVRPMGASVHYAGTVPMAKAGTDSGAWTSDANGRSRTFENLYFADGTTFPRLPAKNLTFTLMANATRIAERAF